MKYNSIKIINFLHLRKNSGPLTLSFSFLFWLIICIIFNSIFSLAADVPTIEDDSEGTSYFILELFNFDVIPLFRNFYEYLGENYPIIYNGINTTAYYSYKVVTWPIIKTFHIIQFMNNFNCIFLILIIIKLFSL